MIYYKPVLIKVEDYRYTFLFVHKLSYYDYVIHEYVTEILTCVREAAKKLFFLVARPLRP